MIKDFYTQLDEEAGIGTATLPDYSALDEESKATSTLLDVYPKATKGIVKYPLSFGAALSSGLSRGESTLVNTIGDIADLTVDYLNYGIGLKPTEKQPTPRINKSEIFHKVANELSKNADYWDEQFKEFGGDAVTGFVGKVVGTLPPGIAEWMMNVPYATLGEAAKAHKAGEPIGWEAIKGGAKRYILGKVLNAVSLIKNPVARRGLGGVTLGGAAAIEGAPPIDIATQATMGALLTGGRPREIPPETAKAMPFESPEVSHLKTVDVIGQNVKRYGIDKLQSDYQEWLKTPEAINYKKAVGLPEGHKFEEVALVEKFNRSLLSKDLAPPEGITPIGEAPTAPMEAITPITEEHRQLFRQTAEQAKGIIPAVETEISKARGQIAGEMRPKIRTMQERGVPTEDAIKRSIPKGAYTEYTQRFPSIREQLGPEATEAYFSTIPANPVFRGREFKIKHTQEAFTKLIDGSYLTMTEAGVLEKHFGRFAPEVAELAKTRVPMGDKVWQTMREIANIPYTTLTSILDMSGLLRQGRFLVQRYPQLAPEYAKKYAQSFASEKATQRIMDEIANSPNVERAVRVGKLQLAEQPSFYEEPIAVEETKIAVPLLERIPLVGKYLIRPTARSFTAGLDWYRMAIVDRAISTAERAGRPLTDKQLKRLCTDINDMSGRSALPRSLKQIAPFVNMFFAPRFAISRLKLLGRAPYRPNVALGWASLIGTNMLIMELAKKLWPDDVEVEPDLRAADGGKIKVRNMRIDLWAGELPYIRTMMRLATGETKTATGRYVPIDYQREIFNVLRARESPLYSLITDAITGNTFIGEQLGAPPRGKWGEMLTKKGVPKWLQGVGKEAWNRLGPLTMQDTVDTLIEEGVPMAITAIVLSGAGIGIQTYPETPSVTAAKLKDQISQTHFGKDWEDIGPIQQNVLKLKYKQIRDAEQQIQLERAKQEGDYKYVARMIVEEKKAGKNVYKRLNPVMRSTLDQSGITLGLSRKIGDWQLNDDRYRRYQDLTVKGFNTINIDKLTKSPNWINAPDEEKEKMIKLIVDTVKEVARKKIVEETYPRKK